MWARNTEHGGLLNMDVIYQKTITNRHLGINRIF